MTTPARLGPIPRTVAFDFERPTPVDWLAGSLAGSTLLDGYTILFPALETIMIRAVASVGRERADLADLDHDVVRDFIRQESAHARDHRRSLQLLEAQGFRVDRTDHNVRRFCEEILAPLSRVLGHTFVIGIYAGAEHWTAGFSAVSLEDGLLPIRLGGDGTDSSNEPSEMELLFLWHCCEELEHKAVVANVFAALGGREVTRVASYVCASIVIEAMSLAVTAALLRQLPRVLGPVEWQRRGGWRGLTRQARRECGGIPRAHWAIFRRYLDRGFHPDDDDTTAILAERLDRLQHLRRWIERTHTRG